MTKEIPLSKQGKNKGKFSAIVDDDDYEYLSKFRWCAAKMYKGKLGTLYYAVRRVNKKTVYMHRVILAVKDNQIIDHIDGNGLNNVKENIHIVSVSENSKNTFATRNFTKYINDKISERSKLSTSAQPRAGSGR